MEKQKFEDAFRDAFKDAEVSPSDHVWTNVALELERIESGRMKRRLLFFKLVAAAAVVFAIMVAGASLYVIDLRENTTADNAMLALQSKPIPQSLQNTTDSGQTATAIERLQASEQANTSPYTAIQPSENQSINLPSPGQNTAPGQTEEALLQEEAPWASARTRPNRADGNSVSTVENSRRNARRSGADLGNQKKNETTLRNESHSKEAPALDGAGARRENALAEATKLNNQPLETGVVGKEATQGATQKTLPQLPRKRAMEDAAQALPSLPSEQLAVAPGVNNTDAAIYMNAGETDHTAQPILAHQTADTQAWPAQDATMRERSLPPIVNPYRLIPEVPQFGPSKLDLLLAELAQLEEESKQKKNKKKDKVDRELWAAAGGSAGPFTNLNSDNSQSNVTTLTTNKALSKEAAASGEAYTMGVVMGGNVSPRWMLQGGVNYLMQNASYDAGGIVRYENQSYAVSSNSRTAAADVLPTANYSVVNSLRYVSVPLKAGYRIVDRAFGLQLNGGVSTDLFLQNTITTGSNDLTEATYKSGDDSPYETWNFSALLGTELSYRFSERYWLALNPGLRFPFSSIYKEETGLEASPLTFDVGVRLRYIFQ